VENTELTKFCLRFSSERTTTYSADLQPAAAFWWTLLF